MKEEAKVGQSAEKQKDETKIAQKMFSIIKSKQFLYLIVKFVLMV